MLSLSLSCNSEAIMLLDLSKTHWPILFANEAMEAATGSSAKDLIMSSEANIKVATAPVPPPAPPYTQVAHVTGSAHSSSSTAAAGSGRGFWEIFKITGREDTAKSTRKAADAAVAAQQNFNLAVK